MEHQPFVRPRSNNKYNVSLASQLSPPMEMVIEELSGDTTASGYMERPVLEGELSGDIAAEGYRSSGLQEYGSGKSCAGKRAFGGYSRVLQK